MNLSRHDPGQRLILPMISLHLFFSLYFLLHLQAITTGSNLIVLFLAVCCALTYGRFFGLLSGLFLAIIQAVSLVLFQYPQSPALAIAFSAASLQPFADLFRQVVTANWTNLAFLPVFGFLSGLYAETFGIRRPRAERRLLALGSANQALQAHVGQLEDALQSLSHERVYNGAWASMAGQSPLNEHLVGILLAADTAVPQPQGDPRQTGAADVLFDGLVRIRPEVLAITGLDGRILRANGRLLAIFGYPLATALENTSIIDLLLPEDAVRAAENIQRVLTAGLKKDECYRIRPAPPRQYDPILALGQTKLDSNSIRARYGTAAGIDSARSGSAADGQPDATASSFSRLLISPEIILECVGNPLSLVASVRIHELGGAAYPTESAEAAPNLPAPATLGELAVRSQCCLMPGRSIFYVDEQAAELLGKPAGELLGRRFDRFISWKHTDRLETLQQACLTGRRSTLEIEMLPIDGQRRILRIDAFPAIGSDGQYLGCTILLDDISSVRLVEEALQHRLAMEKLISSISTRFISVPTADLDQEIGSVLKLIGDFEEAEESKVEIYVSKRVSQAAEYSVVNARVSERARAETGPRRQERDRFETISVPIVIDHELAGSFLFLQECYRNAWFETDFELIRLIGEIIINGLIRKENERDIKRNETRLATTIHSITEAVIATDPDGRIILMNQAAENLTGWNLTDALNKPIDQVFQPDVPTGSTDDDEHVNAMHPLSETDDSRLLTSLDGAQRFIQSSRAPIRDELSIYGEVTVFRDVTREKRENDEIRYVSYHDKLTGLYNRAFFEEELIRLNTQRQYPITIIIGDCNGLKIANDIFGHLEGDRLLQTIANILRKATRHEDILVRWGGDEFAIILPKTDEAAGALICERILQFCAEAPFDPIQPSLAVGSATNTEKGLAIEDLVSVLKLAEDRMYRHKLADGKSSRNTLLRSIEKMIYDKRYETEEHASRLKDISLKLGHAVGLSSFEQEELSLLSVLHDIGKIGIPDDILTKPEKLNGDEWTIMRKHSEKGYDLAKSTPGLAGIADFILHHHERWDGSGYPAGLQGEEIPKLSRILSIIDAYDAITHTRTYKPAQSKADALDEIQRCSGSQFDPELTRAFIEIMKQD